MGLVVRNVTFMTTNPVQLADFWAAAMGYTQRRESEDEILLAPEDWGYPRFTFQRIAVPRDVPGPLHLDLTAADMPTEVDRLVRLGATRLRTVESADSGSVTWTVLRDPDGNEFCVVQAPPSD